MISTTSPCRLQPIYYSWVSATIRLSKILVHIPSLAPLPHLRGPGHNYVQEIFGAQQTRMWVDRFMFCGEDFRAWMFDRESALGTNVINIHNEPLLFLKAIIGLTCMDATELGFDPTICWKLEGEAASIV